jgi:hypothetical protein
MNQMMQDSQNLQESLNLPAHSTLPRHHKNAEREREDLYIDNHEVEKREREIQREREKERYTTKPSQKWRYSIDSFDAEQVEGGEERGRRGKFYHAVRRPRYMILVTVTTQRMIQLIPTKNYHLLVQRRLRQGIRFSNHAQVLRRMRTCRTFTG